MRSKWTKQKEKCWGEMADDMGKQPVMTAM